MHVAMQCTSVLILLHCVLICAPIVCLYTQVMVECNICVQYLNAVAELQNVFPSNCCCGSPLYDISIFICVKKILIFSADLLSFDVLVELTLIVNESNLAVKTI